MHTPTNLTLDNSQAVPFCPPPADHEASHCVAALRIPAQAGGTLKPSVLCPLALQITKPDGWWVNANTCSVIGRRWNYRA
jgi:hypothetical protein